MRRSRAGPAFIVNPLPAGQEVIAWIALPRYALSICTRFDTVLEITKEEAEVANWKAWAGTALILAATSVHAASPPAAGQSVDTARAMLDRMDRNVDGKISEEEYRNAMVRRFGARDVNDDGVLEGDEFPKEWLAGADVNRATGKVTWEQFTAELPLVFAGFDNDKDGQLDAAEIGRFAAARKTQEGNKP
jgi:EF hand